MIEIIPAIDIIDGKCVRLTKGDYARKNEYGDPFDIALRFVDHGIQRLHLVDLDGAREGRVINFKVLEKIASKTSLIIDVGGGITSRDDLRIVFESGAQMITGGSVAVKNQEEFESWIIEFGNESIILGSDFKDGKIAVSGWMEESDLKLMDFLKLWTAKGISKTICTDISRDGVLNGPSESIYKRVLEKFPELYLIASGGVSSLEDIISLQEAGIPAVIIGKAIYEGKIELAQLEQFL
jgi:phosphoribosylformimino-5-aminoimidazole carboxamide ribotide isomerase